MSRAAMRGPCSVRRCHRGALLGACLVGAFGAGTAPGQPGLRPESLRILLPEAHPQQVVLSTNFGLYISDGDGATWTWTCEQLETTSSFRYEAGAPPLNRISRSHRR